MEWGYIMLIRLEEKWGYIMLIRLEEKWTLREWNVIYRRSVN